MPDPSLPARRRSPLGPILLAVVACALVAGGIFALRPRQPPPEPPTPHAAESSPAPTAAIANAPTPTDATPTPSQFQPPKVLTTRPAAYPEQAFLNRVEGIVRVRFSVDETGRVTEVVTSRSSGSVLLDALALSHDLKQWTFQPATLDGKPVPGTVEKEFEFRLDPAQQRAQAAKRLAAKIGTPDAPYPREALASKARGECTISVTWTPGGLVDRILLTKSSGSNILDRVALRFAYENWRVDPKDVKPDEEFIKTMAFTPPVGPNDTPPPLTTTAPDATTPAASTAP